MVSGPADATAARPRDDPCTICRLPRTRTGDHRGVALPCGHSFGHSCISRRLRSGPGRCPQCGARCSVTQLRPVPGQRSSCSAEGDKQPEETRRDREELRRERAERRRLERDLVETRQRLLKRENVVRMLQGELKKLQRRVRLEESDYDCDSNVSTPRTNERGDLTE